MANGRISRYMAFHGLPWPSMPISLPFDGLLQDIRELIDPTDCRHALLRAQAAAGAACLSSMSCTEDKTLCCQIML